MKKTGSRSLSAKKLAFSGMFLALALVLPLLTGQIPEIGSMLCPMHLPVLLCGFICGWQSGLVVGLIAPLLRFVLFGMPPLFPTGVAMALELATYGAMTGMLYRALPKKFICLYFNLIASMIAGRLVWGAVRYLIAGFQNTQFGFAAFWAGAVVNAIPGIIVQLVLVPLVVLAFQKSKLSLNEGG